MPVPARRASRPERELDVPSATDASDVDGKPTLEEVGEEREIAGIRLGNRRRRPSGEPPPLPYDLRTSGRFWLALSALALALWVLVFAVRSLQPPVERADD